MLAPRSTRRDFLRGSVAIAGTAALLSPRELAALAPESAAWVRGLDATARARNAGGPVILARNENPYGMNPKAKVAFLDAFAQHNRYNSPQASELRTRFAAQLGVPDDHVLVTAGSREVLALAVAAFAGKGKEVITPWPSFEEVGRYGDVLGLTVHRVPQTAALEMDLKAMDARIGANTGLVFLCNPQNPTSTVLAGDVIRDFVRATAPRAMVLVDEAYHEYVDDRSYRSMIELVKAGDDVILSRTASKIHGMAGVRIGFAIAKPAILAKLAAFLMGQVNPLAAAAVVASLNDPAYTTWCAQQNAIGRAFTIEAIRSMGRRVIASHTNFVFFDAGRPNAEVRKALEAAGYLVGRAFPNYANWVRVSIGTPDEMKGFIAALPPALRV